MRIPSFNYHHIKPFFNLAVTFRLSLFLLLCFILGGTSQDIVAPKLFLYIISLFVIGGCLSVLTKNSAIWKLKPVVLIWIIFFGLHLIYLIPLPPTIWTGLNGREFLVEGFQTIGMNPPWLPLSMAPEKTFFSLFDFLPPLAIILLMGTVVTAREFRTALWSLGVFVLISVFLGMMQVIDVGSEMYFYNITNEGSAVGFFSNANHYGVFLLMSIPLLACLADYNRADINGRHRKTFTFCIVSIFSALLGVGLSGSLAGYLLIVPIVTATLLVWSNRGKLRKVYLFSVVASLLAALLFDMFIWNNMQIEIADKFTSVDTSTRKMMFENTFQMTKDFFPLGSGPGSFSDVYRLFEVADRYTIPHSHNEYIEIAAELGLLGIIGLILVLFWLAKNIFIAAFAKAPIHNGAKFMSIAIVTVAFHSIFDFSLRTIAIMVLAVFSVCCVILSNKNIEMKEN